jgi:hypothetical protein
LWQERRKETMMVFTKLKIEMFALMLFSKAVYELLKKIETMTSRYCTSKKKRKFCVL